MNTTSIGIQKKLFSRSVKSDFALAMCPKRASTAAKWRWTSLKEAIFRKKTQNHGSGKEEEEKKKKDKTEKSKDKEEEGG
jgi:hypothetical protein